MPLLEPDTLTPWSIRRRVVPHLIRHAGCDLCEDLTVKINMEQLPNSQHRISETKQKGETFGIPLIGLYLKNVEETPTHVSQAGAPHTPPTQEQYKSSNNSSSNTCKTISRTEWLPNKTQAQIVKPSSPTVQNNSPSSPAAKASQSFLKW